MSTIFKTVVGDTFDIISRKNYGTEQEASRISEANPGVSEPLVADIELIIPALPNAPQNVQQQVISNNVNEVSILIDNKRFRFWDKVRIVRSVDAMDIIEFGAPFDSKSLEFREIFRPFSFKSIIITVGGDPIFTGTMVSVSPVIENGRKLITVSGYSLPGVLNDCTPSANSLDLLEFRDQGLQEISAAIVKPFGVGVEFLNNQGAVFEQVACNATKKILSFLIELAKQRNLIISSTNRGKLLFQQSVDIGNPVAILQQGSSPVLIVAPSFKPQEYYSHITGLEPAVTGSSGSKFTVKNSRLLGVIRPIIFNVTDTSNADIKTAAEARMGRMFGNAAAYSIRVATWRDSFNNLWAPNTTVKLLAPDAMIYNEYEFIIRSVEFQKDKVTESAVLNLIIPGSFSGQIPKNLPWDE